MNALCEHTRVRLSVRAFFLVCASMGEWCGIAFLQWVTGRKFLNKYERRKCRMKKGETEWGKCIERKRKAQGQNARVALVRFSRLGQMNHKDSENSTKHKKLPLYAFILSLSKPIHTKSELSGTKMLKKVSKRTMNLYELVKQCIFTLNADQCIQVSNFVCKTGSCHQRQVKKKNL